MIQTIKLERDGFYFVEKDIKVEFDRYPDGQKNVNLTAQEYDKLYISKNDTFDIVASIVRFEDLQDLLCLSTFLEENTIDLGAIIFTYFMGMRSDRRFTMRGINYFKTVLIPILDKLYSNNRSQIIFNFPHNPALVDLVIGGKSDFDYDFLDYWRFPPNSCNVKDKGAYWKESIPSPTIYYDCNKIIAADEGALRFADTDCFTKTRTDNIPQILDVKISGVFGNHLPNILIVDDLLDGGATHVQCYERLIDEMKELRIARRPVISLFVYHAFFSSHKNIAKLNEYYDYVYYTDSVNINRGSLPSNFICLPAIWENQDV